MPQYLSLFLVLFLSACSTFPTRFQPDVDVAKCDQKLNYSIESNRFDETAQQIAHATGCFIQTDLTQTGAIRVQPIKGYMSPRQAIAQSIQDTPLKIVKNEPNQIVVK